MRADRRDLLASGVPSLVRTRANHIRGFAAMGAPGRPNLVVIWAAGLIGGSMVPAAGRADERPPPVAAAWLREFDLSPDIKLVTRPREAVTLKPRSTPGYDQLSSAL